tara:strand:- start:193 stop:366 length:174 start_codon:yes stop_codon:yes gene_type:complete
MFKGRYRIEGRKAVQDNLLAALLEGLYQKRKRLLLAIQVRSKESLTRNAAPNIEYKK